MDGTPLRAGEAAGAVGASLPEAARLAVLSNASSGTGRARTRVAAVAREAGIPHVVTRHAGELAEALAVLARRGTNVLAVDGGDGTLHATVSALRRTRILTPEPVIALLPGGTTNMVHRDVGIAGSPDRALRRVIAACRLPQRPIDVVSRSTVSIGHDHNPAQRQYGFFLGAGAIPRAIGLARHRLHPWGLTGPVGEALGMAWLFRRLLAGRVLDDPVLKPEQLACAVDGVPWAGREIVLLLATTLERLLLGLKPGQAREELRLLALAWPYEGLWRALPRLAAGRTMPASARGLTLEPARKIVLQPGAAYVLDGELAEVPADAPLTVTAGPPVRFLRV